MEQKKHLEIKNFNLSNKKVNFEFIIKKNNLYNKFLGTLTKRGNKVAAKNILEKTITVVSRKLKRSKSLLFLKLFLKLNTFVESKKVKVRNRSHIVPFSLTLKRRSYLVLKWIMQAAKENRAKIPMYKKLSTEFINILRNKNSKSLNLKKQNNFLAIKNRSNAHFRW